MDDILIRGKNIIIRIDHQSQPYETSRLGKSLDYGREAISNGNIDSVGSQSISLTFSLS